MNVEPSLRIVLTGSSSGIGRALAQRLLSRGHQVWGIARSEQTDPSVSSAGAPGAFRFLRCDVADWGQVQQAAQTIASGWPAVDALITCAGVQGAVGPALAADPAEWSATVRTNLDGTFHAIRAFAELLSHARRRAKIVCFSGGGATKSRPNFSAYGVAKTGIVRLVETIAGEEKDRPFDINAIAPGAINTRMTDQVIALGPDIVGSREYESATKQKQSGGDSLPRAIDLVEWLLSEASDGVSGRLISAQWDDWTQLPAQLDAAGAHELFRLRRITAENRVPPAAH